MPALPLKVGRTNWIEAFDVMVHGKDEDDNPVAISEGPFRTAEIAAGWAKARHRGHKYDVTVTLVPEGEKFVGIPRASRKPPAKKNVGKRRPRA